VRTDLQEAIAELRKGQPDSMERALALLQQTAFSFSMKVCGHREDAEDTAQETLIRTVAQLRHFDSPEALAVWLYKVARSRCLMSRRRSKFAPKQTLSLDDLVPDRSQLEALTASRDGGPEQQLLRAENREELQRAVMKIPPDYRMVLVLHDMEELSTDEVARVTGLRPGTVLPGPARSPRRAANGCSRCFPTTLTSRLTHHSAAASRPTSATALPARPT
jgi:RNA polymerase sigma-70 factor (ECF subfamily)